MQASTVKRIDADPDEPWSVLLSHALTLIDTFSSLGGVRDPLWTFGGGTVLMLRYGHRRSKDVDIFVPDPQYLGYVSPRLSDLAAELSDDYVEAAAYVKSSSSRARSCHRVAAAGPAMPANPHGFFARSRAHPVLGMPAAARSVGDSHTHAANLRHRPDR